MISDMILSWCLWYHIWCHKDIMYYIICIIRKSMILCMISYLYYDMMYDIIHLSQIPNTHCVCCSFLATSNLTPIVSIIEAGSLWPCGQGGGLAVVRSPVRTLPPREYGGALVVWPGMPFPKLDGRIHQSLVFRGRENQALAYKR